MIIDTHVHLIYRNKIKYSWLNDVPELDSDATYESYAQQARQLDIVNALHMEVDVEDNYIDAETTMISDLATRPDSIITGAIAACRPEDINFSEYLDRQKQNPIVKGFRRVLHVVPDALSTSARFRENINKLADTNYVYDICMLAQQLPLAAELVDHCPKVQFVLDHCGVPDIKGNQYSQWAPLISELAKRENLSVKISGVMAYADGYNWTLEDLKPYVEHCIESFGWDRVVWGSDSPVCTMGGSLSSWVAATYILLEHCSSVEKEALFSTNAKRLWNL